MELIIALNFLGTFPGAKQSLLALAEMGKQNPEALKEIIRFLKIKTAQYDKSER
jgi:hypothetical protein